MVTGRPPVALEMNRTDARRGGRVARQRSLVGDS